MFKEAGASGVYRMKKPDGKSFEELAVPHMETVYRVALRWCGDRHEAEDLVQDTYLKAYKAFDRFEMREFGIRPWLLRILHNTFLNRVSRQNRAPKATEQQVLEQVEEMGNSGESLTAPPALDYEKLDGEVKSALERLAPEFREALTLWSTMDLSYQEIADILEVPIGTVMSRLHRARQQMARELEEYARKSRLAVGGRDR